MARKAAVEESSPASGGVSLDRQDRTFRLRRSGADGSGQEQQDDTSVLRIIPPPSSREPLQVTSSKMSSREPLQVTSSKMTKQSFLKSCWIRVSSFFSIKLWVLLILCLQNSLFTVTRRYSQGVLKESYSKYEVLLMGEVIKMLFSAYMIGKLLPGGSSTGESGVPDDMSEHSHNTGGQSLHKRLLYIISKSQKMMVLAAIYGAMNILSFVSLRNIGAGMFTIFAQCKILTTATFSTFMLQRQYSSTQWRALVGLMFGVLLFSEPTLWGPNAPTQEASPNGNPLLGTVAVLIEVTLSGFASIYFEKVIKTDPLQLNIWERNFQLALTSFPVYLCFIVADGGGTAGLGGGWTGMTWIVALLGAAGGLLVALSIKYGDAILKTLATTGAIVLSSLLDFWLLDGPLTPTMMIAAVQVILSIFNYSFDMTPPAAAVTKTPPPSADTPSVPPSAFRSRPSSPNPTTGDVESIPLVRRANSKDTL